MKLLKFVVFLAIFCSAKTSFAQDSAALLKEYNKIMSFAAQPNISYRILTTINSYPILQNEDTMSISGRYIKYGNDFYSGNTIEDIYLEDSFLIEVNHLRKNIFIRKVDMNSKQNLNKFSLSSYLTKDFFKENTIYKKVGSDKKSAEITMTNNTQFDSLQFLNSQISIKYSTINFYPEYIIMDVKLRKQISDYEVGILKQQGGDVDKLIENIDSINYMVRRQSFKISFFDIRTEENKILPSWKSKLIYDSAKKDFIINAKDLMSYEIVKTY